jgi:hypothetical protein
MNIARLLAIDQGFVHLRCNTRYPDGRLAEAQVESAFVGDEFRYAYYRNGLVVNSCFGCYQGQLAHILLTGSPESDFRTGIGIKNQSEIANVKKGSFVFDVRGLGLCGDPVGHYGFSIQSFCTPKPNSAIVTGTEEFQGELCERIQILNYYGQYATFWMKPSADYSIVKTLSVDPSCWKEGIVPVNGFEESTIELAKSDRDSLWFPTRTEMRWIPLQKEQSKTIIVEVLLSEFSNKARIREQISFAKFHGIQKGQPVLWEDEEAESPCQFNRMIWDGKDLVCEEGFELMNSSRRGKWFVFLGIASIGGLGIWLLFRKSTQAAKS